MKNIFVVIIFLTISFAMLSSVFAQSNLDKELTKADLTNNILSSTGLSVENNIKNNFHKSISAGEEKSAVLGGALSALLPGAGEFYAKSFVKSAIFIALEAGLWIGYAVYQNKGNTQTDQFHAFADAKWSVRKYATWLRDQAGATGINPNEADLNILRNQINAFEAGKFSHTLPEYGAQQYYELIGKYQNFVPGWEDASPTISATVNYSDPNSYVNVKTGMFNSYAIDRQQANDYYDASKRFVSGVIINHVLSIADAIWSVSIYNKNLQVKTGLRIQERFGGFLMERYTLPMANVSVQF